jgi:hypothetical protein
LTRNPWQTGSVEAVADALLDMARLVEFTALLKESTPFHLRRAAHAHMNGQPAADVQL